MILLLFTIGVLRFLGIHGLMAIGAYTRPLLIILILLTLTIIPSSRVIIVPSFTSSTLYNVVAFPPSNVMCILAAGTRKTWDKKYGGLQRSGSDSRVAQQQLGQQSQVSRKKIQEFTSETH